MFEVFVRHGPNQIKQVLSIKRRKDNNTYSINVFGCYILRWLILFALDSYQDGFSKKKNSIFCALH